MRPTTPLFDGVLQFAYLVEDIEQSIDQYVSHLGIGPWFVWGPFVPGEQASYLGEPASMRITLARAFSGNVMLELVQQDNEAPSPYLHAVRDRRFGFHHWARAVADLDAELRRYRALGGREVFEDVLPSGARVVYVEPAGDLLPGLIELIELTPGQEVTLTNMYSASRNWDGAEPIRQG